MKTCPECGSNKVEMKTNELFCKECGLVIEEAFYSGKRAVV